MEKDTGLRSAFIRLSMPLHAAGESNKNTDYMAGMLLWQTDSGAQICQHRTCSTGVGTKCSHQGLPSYLPKTSVLSPSYSIEIPSTVDISQGGQGCCNLQGMLQYKIIF